MTFPKEPGDDFNPAHIHYDPKNNALYFDLILPEFYPRPITSEIFIHSPSHWPLSQTERVQTPDGTLRFRSHIPVHSDRNHLIEESLYPLIKSGQRTVETVVDLKYGK